jgi:hypothetical protein
MRDYGGRFFLQFIMRLLGFARNDAPMTFLSLAEVGGVEAISTRMNPGQRPLSSSLYFSQTSTRIVFMAVVSFLHIMLIAEVRGQDFPYLAPSAPEFDGRGNLVREAAKPSQSLSANAPSKTPSQTPMRIEAPYTPYTHNGSTSSPNTATKPVTAPRAPGYGGSQDASPRPPRQASVPPSPDYQQATRSPSPSASSLPQPQSQPMQRQDCSQFPMLIANCRSEAEMQMTARRYLTCLIQNGWNMDQARQHVISTIESTYRLAR